VTFEARTGRFEAQLRPGASIARAQVIELIDAHARARGESYVIRWGEPPSGPTAEVTTHARPFSLTTLSGARYDLGTALGRRPIVLVFWASWCAPCIEEAAELVVLYERYASQVEIVSVSIDAAADHDALRDVVARLQIPYAVALDPEGTVLSQYATGASIPLTLVIDIEGTVVYRRGNYEPGDERALDAAIGGALTTR
jgi:peroxiredoxin